MSASGNPFVHPLQRLTRVAANPKPLWVVAHVDAKKGAVARDRLVGLALQDTEAAIQGGADGVILINEWCSLEELEASLAMVRQRYPQLCLGVNYLGDESEPYGYRESFRLARDYGLSVVWTDFAGVDLIVEKPPIDLHAIAEARKQAPEAFYCSGVHMKYSTPRDPGKTVEESALQAMGWVDGIVITGPKTGVLCDVGKLGRARAAVGEYPIGLASGVSAENAGQVRELADFYIVATSLMDGDKRILSDKVAELVARLR